MPIDTKHSDIARAERKWVRCRDTLAGQDAVHGAGEAYLPKLKEQTDPEYQAYKMRGTFFNASARTRNGLLGMLFRKPPEVETPASMREWVDDDIDLAGTPFTMFAHDIATEVLSVGRVGILVDFPRVEPGLMTVGQAEAANIRPMLRLYRAESITNWQTGRVAGAQALVRVVLFERVEEENPSDPFAPTVIDQYRELSLVNGMYQVVVWRKAVDGSATWIPSPPLLPVANGKTMSEIPFIFVSPYNNRPEVVDPPMEDLINVNLAHYRVTADYEHGCHFTGLPTPVVSGYTPANKDEKLYIGSASAWIFTSPEASASYLEFTGTGLATLKENLASKESQMAILGARILAPDQKGVESAEAAGIHRQGEHSVMSDISQAISKALTRALEIASTWAGIGGKSMVELNREFTPVTLTAPDLAALVKAWQDGAFSYETLYANLKAGDIVPADGTPEKEKAAREDEGPTLTEQTMAAKGPAKDDEGSGNAGSQ